MRRNTLILVAALALLKTVHADAEELEVIGEAETELVDLEIDEAGEKREEEPMADLEDPATATLDDEMADEETEE
jgi:hypothetical protein